MAVLVGEADSADLDAAEHAAENTMNASTSTHAGSRQRGSAARSARGADGRLAGPLRRQRERSRQQQHQGGDQPGLLRDLRSRAP